MPIIEWDRPQRPMWIPALDKIVMSDEPYFKERAPMVLIHEMGHREYDQVLPNTDPLTDIVQERDAWRFALSKLPPDEIDLDFIEESMVSYLDNVEDEYGRDSREFNMARGFKADILGLARRKKGGD